MIKGYCYVVPPATFKARDWEWVYNVVIQPLLARNEITCDLGRVMGESGVLIDNILSKLLQAEFAIVDVTETDDPRTHYLLGVRHARSNRTILISQSDESILNDFRPYRVITYSSEGREINRFQEQLHEFLKQIRSAPEEPDNPVQRFLGGAGLVEENQALQAKLADLEKTVRENTDLQGKVTELERTLTTLASAPQQPPHQTIKFKPVPPIG